MDTTQSSFVSAADALARLHGLPAYSALLKASQGFVADFGPTIDADRPLRGCDAVDGVVDHVIALRAVLNA